MKVKRIALIADIHGNLEYLSRFADTLSHADEIWIAGDITQMGRGDAAAKMLKPLIEVGRPLWAVSGNCDHPEVVSRLRVMGIGVDGRVVNRGDSFLFGIGGALKGPGSTPQTYTEEHYGRLLERMTHLYDYQNPLAVLAHQPPYRSGSDRVAKTLSVGSRSFRSWIIEVQPDLFACGHIHESASIKRIGQTLVVNPGPFSRGRMAWITWGDLGAEAELLSADNPVPECFSREK